MPWTVVFHLSLLNILKNFDAVDKKIFKSKIHQFNENLEINWKKNNWLYCKLCH